MKFDAIVLSGSESIALFNQKDPLASPFITRSVSGLGPTEVEVNLSQTTQGRGIFVGRRPQLREMTFNIELNPNYSESETSESLREYIYRLQMQSIEEDGSLTLGLYFEGIEVAQTPVFVKRLETAPFAKENIIQLVLSSPDQYLHAPSPIQQMSPDLAITNPTLRNEGTAPTGFLLNIRITQVRSSFGLSRHWPTQHLRVDHPFEANDILTIDTQVGSRGVWLTRNNIQTSILGSMSSDSTWLVLPPGNNLFSTTPAGNADHIWVDFSYHPKYLGV